MGDDTEVIAAIATAPGRGGVGIVRVSGRNLAPVLEQLVGTTIPPRHAHYCEFRDGRGGVVDQGLALFFPAPKSFTGEDVIELHGHGGPVVMDALLARVLELGARIARPGEFSERAFLNGKLDLAQAEGIADLIAADSALAARNALRTLQGAFSQRIHVFTEALVRLRVYVEAAIDFPEEDIDFLSEGAVGKSLDELIQSLDRLVADAGQGVLLQEGMTVVIAGKPNAGKSSLLNKLSGRDSAIVTSIPGTTRDLLRERIDIDGMPLHIIDTAGLRDSADEVEREGIRRAWEEIERADRVLFMVDSTESSSVEPAHLWPEFFARCPGRHNLTVLLNKIDLSGLSAGEDSVPDMALADGAPCPVLRLSATTGAGFDDLRRHLKECMGYRGTTEGLFTARRRHLDALINTQRLLRDAARQLRESQQGELLAADLLQAQRLIGQITGEFTSDDLLGEIFASFCVGK